MKNIKSSSLYPLSFDYTGDDSMSFYGANDHFVANDGYSFVDSPTINDLKDVSLFGRSIMCLTEKKEVSGVLEDKTIEIPNYGVYYFTYRDLDISNGVWGYDEELNIVMTDMDTDTAIGFTLVAINDVSYEGNYKIIFGNYAFEYDYNEDTFIIAKETTKQEQVFNIVPDGTNVFSISGYNPGTSGYQTLSMNISGSNIPSEKTIFASYNYDGGQKPLLSNSLILNGAIIKNDWVRYKDFYTPIYSTTESKLEIDELNIIENVPLNYLLIGGIGSVEISGNFAFAKMDVIPLKNIYNTAYDLYIGKNIPEDTIDVNARDYMRIYLDDTSTQGYQNPILSYKTTKAYNIILKRDEYTYFHLPTDFEEVSIQDSELKENGAFFGASPAFSDRIYKRLGNYSDHIWWGGGAHEGVQDGTWLCAWLSGDIGTNDSTWIERYYDPALLSEEEALSGSTDSLGVVDVVSTMALEPNGYYKYFHVGSKTYDLYSAYTYSLKDERVVVRYVNYDSGELVRNYGVKKIPATISDLDNSIPVNMDTGTNISTNSGILLYGNGDIYINDSSNFLRSLTKDFTIVSWVYFDDVKNKRSTSIYDYYSNGGYKLEYVNKGLYYSYMIPNIEYATYNNTAQKYIYSGDGIGGQRILAYANVDNGVRYANVAHLNLKITAMAMDSDGNTIIVGESFDNEEEGCVLVKIDNYGIILDSVKLKSLYPERIIIKDNNTIIGKNRDYDNDGECSWYSINPYTYTITPSGIVNENKYPYLDISGNVAWEEDCVSLDTYLDGTICKITTDNTVCIGEDVVLNPPYRMKFKDIVAYENDICFVTASSDIVNEFRLYILKKSENYVSKYHAFIDDTLSLKADLYTNVPFISYERINKNLTPVLYWVKGKKITRYEILENNELNDIGESTLEYALFNEDSIIGDYSGYKYNKIINNLNGNAAHVEFSMITTDEAKIKKHIRLPVEEFNDGWNMISIIKTDNFIKMLLNGGTVYSEVSGTNIEPHYGHSTTFSIGGIRNSNRSFYADNSLYDPTNMRIGIGTFTIYNVNIGSDIKELYSTVISRSMDINWPIYSGEKELEEEVKKMYKFKKPGFKTKKMNIVINSFKGSLELKANLTDVIKKSLSDLLEANSEIEEIKWR